MMGLITAAERTIAGGRRTIPRVRQPSVGRLFGQDQGDGQDWNGVGRRWRATLELTCQVFVQCEAISRSMAASCSRQTGQVSRHDRLFGQDQGDGQDWNGVGGRWRDHIGVDLPGLRSVRGGIAKHGGVVLPADRAGLKARPSVWTGSRGWTGLERRGRKMEGPHWS